MKLSDLKIKIFADGADRDGMLDMYKNPIIKGFTTNPTLMRRAGVTDYKAFAKDILREIPDRPISFEVFSDDFGEMDRQARTIASWGTNVYVKVPVTNTKGESSAHIIQSLSRDAVKLNVTALTTLNQVKDVRDSLSDRTPAYISVFAGRIADTGEDPVSVMWLASRMLALKPNVELIWASTRETYNIFQADAIQASIITVPNDILKKLHLWGLDLEQYSLETVRMFYSDGKKAGFTL